ncbi:helix-turn-helix domain-containing protein [Tenacibaculum jejuense]|uniref:Response regulator GacA n=1 Tax=Tenacibaculum jejuense TaxID=584609 RepID=A0A238U9X4_9FLAO|nr:response regulator [Tenacibaculum jejuense]SNR15989.1 Response regulator GacA [Tenacibaculum jejuense]
MFQKVLIAEDADLASSGVRKALEELEIKNIEFTQYCDEAFIKFKNAIRINEPFDLLISDLSFVGNYNEQRLNSGDELVREVKKEDPNLKTIMFSIEDRPFKVKQLCSDLELDGYVWKSNDALKDLKKAISLIKEENFFISPQLAHVLKSKESFEITSFDIFLLQHLADGLEQREISDELKKKGIKPSSTSSVEKRLKLLKENFNANNPTQLVAITKDFGLI